MSLATYAICTYALPKLDGWMVDVTGLLAQIRFAFDMTAFILILSGYRLVSATAL